MYAFTAALPINARPAFKLLDPNNKYFQNIWYLDSCEYFHERYIYAKNLSRVFGKDYTPERTILIDNNVYSFFANPDNGILVKSFYDQVDDDTLEKLLPFMKLCSEMDDVRPALINAYRIRETLTKTLGEYGKEFKRM
jgi:TFIIF-interacting CTD phosphatase-like protein